MRDLIIELKQLRLHGMAAGWAELLRCGTDCPLLAHTGGSRWSDAKNHFATRGFTHFFETQLLHRQI
jgi:hypothetical protein